MLNSIDAAARKFSGSTILVFVFAWVAVLAGTFLNFLNFHEYPLTSGEAGLALAGVMAIGAAAGYVHGKSGIARGAMEAALVYLAIDLSFETEYAAIPAVLAALLYVQFRFSLVTIVAVVFLAVVAGQLVTMLVPASHARPGNTGDTARPALPAIVHIILDEHIGIEGLRHGDPANAALGDDLQAFYTTRGFSVYGGAHSRHSHTISSIPEILNFGAPVASPEVLFRQTSTIGRNEYFSRLAARGYRINVYQSSFVDYCQDPAVSKCNTHRHNDLLPIHDSPLSLGERARFIAVGYVSLSGGLTSLANMYDFIALAAARQGLRPPFINVSGSLLTMPLASLRAADTFVQDLRSARPGNVYFAHFLYPHFPHAVRPDCSVKPLGEWSYLQAGGNLGAQSRGYNDQLRCAMRSVDRMLGALAHSPAADRSIVIVHGDHGSRIVRVDAVAANADLMPESDMFSLYSTLFAVRLGNSGGNYDRTAVPVSELLRQLTNGKMGAAPAPRSFRSLDQRVYVADDEWRPAVLKPMPRFD